METFEKEYRGNVVVITVNLVSATLNDTNEFKGFMEELILLTDCDVVIDLSTCNHLDSTFIGALVMSFKKLKMKNRNMVLVEPNDQTKVFLTMNSLSKIFHLYPDVEVAVEDLLNRNIIENNLTNLKHQVSFEDKSNDNEADISMSEDVTADSPVVEDLKEKVPEEISAESEVNEQENLGIEEKSYDNQVESTVDLNAESNTVLNEATSIPVEQVSNEEQILVDEIKEYSVVEDGKTNAEVLESDSPNSFESKVDEIEYNSAAELETKTEEAVLEFEDVDRDYRQGTVAWDFGL